MDPLNEDIPQRANQYTRQHGLHLERELGSGKDGSVWATDRATAVKVFAARHAYDRELAAYRRLAEHEVRDVLGFHVPQLLRFNGGMLVIEMTVVPRPFLLDFASAWLDESPGFSDEVIEEWREQMLEVFGDRWPQVSNVLAELERFGIYLMDIHPGNIKFTEADE